jgi:leader peptidase (prepilin peptidase) / N-methyltransferase
VIVVVVVGCFGLLVGSFLNVVIWRVPRGESVVHPRSRCPGCGAAIRERDNVPLVSWLLLHGRCRNCGEPISVRYPLVELGTGVLFAMLAWKIGAHADLPAFLYLGAVGLALAVIDLDTHRLPNALTLPSYPIAAALLTIAALVDHHPGLLVRAAAGGAAFFALYALLWILYPGGMGLGDVKLAGVLGLYLGYLGWGAVAVGGFLGFGYGAVIGVALMAGRKAGRKTRIPFGPFMVAGALTAVFVGNAIAHAYLGLSRN